MLTTRLLKESISFLQEGSRYVNPKKLALCNTVATIIMEFELAVLLCNIIMQR